jgi:hypothetical protein
MIQNPLPGGATLDNRAIIMIKITVVALLAAIIISLGSGLFYLYRDQGKSRKMVTALTFRVGFSLLLFAVLMIAWAMGWIHPHGAVPPAR